jgi:hypothetical protein
MDCLQRNGTFKSQITLDRHNARPRLNYYFLPDPSHFSLPSTFNIHQNLVHSHFASTWLIHGSCLPYLFLEKSLPTFLACIDRLVRCFIFYVLESSYELSGTFFKYCKSAPFGRFSMSLLSDYYLCAVRYPY